MGPAPLSPARIAFHEASLPTPRGVTAPRPVTTARRLLMVFKSSSFRSSSFLRARPRARLSRSGAASPGRRPGTALALVLPAVLPDVLHGLADGADLLRILIGDAHVKFFLKLHHQFHDVEGIGPEVIDEARF